MNSCLRDQGTLHQQPNVTLSYGVSNKKFKTIFLLGSKQYYYGTLACYVQSLHDTVQSWHKKVLKTSQLTRQHAAAHEYQLDNTQTAIANTIINSTYTSDEHYDTNFYQLGSESDDDSEHDEIPGIAHDMINYALPTCDWKKIFLITRKPGTEKNN